MSAKRVTEVRSRSVALSGKADGWDALEPLARFTSNPAGAVVAGEVRSLAQRSEAAAARTGQAAELAALVATFRLPEETRVRSADAAA